LSVQDGNVTLTHFRETEGVTDSVYFIGHDHKENVWIGTPDGAVVLPKGGKPHRLNSLDGLLWNDCNGDGFFLDADEAIWIGTSGGLARYDQTPVGATPPPPRVFLTSVSFGSLKPALDESPRVSWKDRRFSVAFFALSVEDPGEVTYSYRLHGYSATDIVTKASTAEFGGLPPGRYRFEVSARSPRGGASVQNASFSFEVSPAWWATYWFAILCGAVLVLSGFLLVRGRTAALILGKRALERTVTERTAQLQRLSHAVEQAASAIIITDVSGRIEFANCAFSRITGYTAEEVIGKTPRVIQSGQTPAGVYSKLWSTIISGRTWRGEMLNRRKDGSLFWELTIISPILDSSGRITHFVAVNEDITERKRTEEELLQAREKAEAASIAKGSFLANMSHEIRTPMNGIIGMTELLLGTPLSSTQRGFAETVWASADSLLTIVNDILDLSRIEAGKLSLEMAEFDIRTLVEETATSLAGRLQGTDVAFACFVHTRVPTWVTGDATRIRQLLTNLVGNAMKFTVTGEVVVEVGVAGEGELPASVRFEIRDTGPGIPASQLKELFKPFVQADSSRSRSHGGTGLGLVISKRLVELMGGEIGLESEEGRGAVAHFTIPLGRAARAGKGPTDVSVNVSGMPVLVAEARTLHAKALRSLLTRWDCRVTEVNSWAEANSALCGAAGAGHPFRAAFLDWSLPGIPEPRLLRRPQQGPVHFILLSSQNDIVEVSREYADHVLAFLSRPVTRAALMRALEKVETGIGQSQPLVFPSPVFSTAPSRRVLVVEDHEVNRKVIYRILERLGHVADLVENGAEAIEALQRRCYDVVLMDVQMPVLDGLETTRRIRSGSAGVIDKDIPIVALTAHAMKGDREECSAAGMTDFIAKPIQSVELALAVERSTRPTPPSHATLAPKYRSPSFDPAALRQRLLGDEEALRDVLEQFLVSFGGEIDRLRGEVAAANVLDVRNLAHRLKGMLGMIGAAGLSQLAGELEVLAAEGKVEAMPVLTQRFHGEATDLARDVRRYLAGETRGEEGAAS
jgi:PAS domain S-box-containing protein